MLRLSIVAFFSLFTLHSHAQNDLNCLVVATYREARGEPLEGVKAVLEVITNRMRASGKSACAVVKARGQFPWAKTQRTWKYSKEALTRFREASSMEAVVGEKAFYFNSKRMRKFVGTRVATIGGHYFYEQRK